MSYFREGGGDSSDRTHSGKEGTYYVFPASGDSICGKMRICKLTGGNTCPGKSLIFEVRNF